MSNFITTQHDGFVVRATCKTLRNAYDTANYRIVIGGKRQPSSSALMLSLGDQIIESMLKRSVVQRLVIQKWCITHKLVLCRPLSSCTSLRHLEIRMPPSPSCLPHPSLWSCLLSWTAPLESIIIASGCPLRGPFCFNSIISSSLLHLDLGSCPDLLDIRFLTHCKNLQHLSLQADPRLTLDAFTVL